MGNHISDSMLAPIFYAFKHFISFFAILKLIKSTQ